MGKPVYDYGYDFQVGILRVMARKVGFLRAHRDCVEPDRFDEDELRYLAEDLVTYHDKYGEPPSQAVFTQVVKADTRIPKSTRSLVSAMIEKLWSEPPEDFIADEVVRFARQSALRSVILESAEMLADVESYPLIEEKVKKAISIGADMADLGYDYFGEAEARLNNVDTVSARRIPTSSVELNDLIGNGPGPGECYICLAPPNTGKTTFLVDTSAHAVMLGNDVAYISGEQKPVPIGYRFDVRLTGMTLNDRKKDPKKFLKKLALIRENRGARVKLWHFVEGSETAYTLRDKLRRAQDLDGFHPKLIVLDYAKLLRPSQSYQELWAEQHRKVLDLRDVLQEMDLPGWTAWQAGQEALYAKYVTMKNAADSFKVTNDADCIIALCQTKQEATSGRIRYYVAKNREGRRDEQCYLRVNYEHCRFSPDDSPVTHDDEDK